MTSAEQRGLPPRRFDSLEQEAFLNLWRTYDRLHVAEEALFEQHQPAHQQYNALAGYAAIIRARWPLWRWPSGWISRAPDITRLLDKLVVRGLVERERPVGNRRTVLVRVSTAEGLQLLGELAKEVRACHQRQLGHLSPDELRQLIDLLYLARKPHEEPSSSWR